MTGLHYGSEEEVPELSLARREFGLSVSAGKRQDRLQEDQARARPRHLSRQNHPRTHQVTSLVGSHDRQNRRQLEKRLLQMERPHQTNKSYFGTQPRLTHSGMSPIQSTPQGFILRWAADVFTFFRLSLRNAPSAHWPIRGGRLR